MSKYPRAETVDQLARLENLVVLKLILINVANKRVELSRALNGVE